MTRKYAFSNASTGITLALITLEEFSEWTVGKEEMYILETQHKIYTEIANIIRSIQGFVFSVHYDNFLAVINNIDVPKMVKEIENISKSYGINLIITFGYGTSAKSALDNISQHYLNNNECILSNKEVICLHFDIDSYLSKTDCNVQAADEFLHRYLTLIRETYSDFVGFHISGDNLIFFGVETDIENIKSKFISLNDDELKLGVGISKYPADAATKSACALEHIRHARDKSSPSIDLEKRFDVVS
jgi:GTP cyclohydrolase III